MRSVKELIAERNAAQKQNEQAKTATTVQTIKPTVPAKEFRVTGDKRASVQALKKGQIVTKQLTTQETALQPTTQQIKPSLVRAELAKKFVAPAASSTKQQNTTDSMTVQTSSGTLATIKPLANGYFAVSFGGDTSTGNLTVSGEMLREMWGIQYAPTNQIKKVTVKENPVASLLEMLDERDFVKNTPKQQTHAWRRAQLNRNMPDFSRDRVSSTDSDSDNEVVAVRRFKF